MKLLNHYFLRNDDMKIEYCDKTEIFLKLFYIFQLSEVVFIR